MNFIGDIGKIMTDSGFDDTTIEDKIYMVYLL